MLQFDEETTRKVERVYMTPDVVEQRRLTRAALAVSAGERVLDIGSGPGLLAAELAQETGADGHVHGIDPSESMLAMARRRPVGRDAAPMDFQAGDALALPVADASFDAAVSTQVLEYVEDVPGALAEARRVLRPGGRLLVTVPFHGRVKGAAIALLRFDAHFDPLGQHLRFYTRSSLAATLERSGFEDVAVRAWGGPPLLRTGLTGRARRA
jgi:ubiquinone/menaquinone biosynthesis C-methylase UbiE